MAKDTMGYGPISPGKSVPSTPTRDVGDSQFGTAMDPGFALNSESFTGKTASKYKNYTREPVPKTPRS